MNEVKLKIIKIFRHKQKYGRKNLNKQQVRQKTRSEFVNFEKKLKLIEKKHVSPLCFKITHIHSKTNKMNFNNCFENIT